MMQYSCPIRQSILLDGPSYVAALFKAVTDCPLALSWTNFLGMKTSFLMEHNYNVFSSNN